MAGLAYRVNGPAIIYIGEQGRSGSLKQLGISEDGANISITPYDDPVFNDDGGSRVPDELQDMGEDATISCRLILYDDDVLRWMFAKRNASEGTQSRRGELIFTAGKGMRIVIDSDRDLPWRFFHCTQRTPRAVKLGTKRNTWDLTWYAIPRGLDGARKLYDRVKG